MIEFQDVSKAYADKKILDHANFTIKSHEFFVLVGPSGSGKTTTLKMINQLVKQSEGKILIDDEDIAQVDLRKLRLSIGYVLQQIALFPNLTVAENIGLIPELKGWNKPQRESKTIELLNLVGLDAKHYANRKPSELSGGEQQRVGILRAIASEPNIVLMDEPFSALDPISRRQLQVFIKDLQKKLGLTVVFVTHDLDEALYLGDRVAVMNEGMIQQIATPNEIYHYPETPFVKQFFNEYQPKLANFTVAELSPENPSIEEAKEVTAQTPLSEILELLASQQSIKFEGKQITSDDLVKFMVSGSSGEEK